MNIHTDIYINNTSSILLISCKYLQNNSLQKHKMHVTVPINKEWKIRKNLVGGSGGEHTVSQKLFYFSNEK